MVAAVVGLLFGVVVNDIGGGIMFGTIAGFGGAVYVARRKQDS